MLLGLGLAGSILPPVNTSIIYGQAADRLPDVIRHLSGRPLNKPSRELKGL